MVWPRTIDISSCVDESLIVFSDLDGSLLDHDTYNWQPASPALDLLRQHGIPLVLVSSKTLAELEVYRERLQLDHPVVAENGAVMDIPADYFDGSTRLSTTSIPRAKLRAAYERVKSAGSFDCVAFDELGIAGIVRATGLTEQQALRARRLQKLANRSLIGRLRRLGCRVAGRG